MCYMCYFCFCDSREEIASSVPLWIAKGVVAGWWTVAGDSLSVHWSLQIIK